MEIPGIGIGGFEFEDWGSGFGTNMWGSGLRLSGFNATS